MIRKTSACVQMRREGFDDSCFRLVAEHCEKVFEVNWKFLLFVLIGGMIGGYCTGIYGYDALSEDALAVLREQHVTREMMAIRILG